MKAQSVPPAARTQLHQAWSNELEAAKHSRSARDANGEWAHLERAHIVSQPLAAAHVRTHLAMLAAATRRRDGHEILGQLFRIVVAAPGTLTGKYPVGNTGGANVSAFAPMPIPEDLRDLIAGRLENTANGQPQDAGADETFPSDPTGLDEATPTEVVELRDGQRCEMRIAPVVKTLDGNRLRMLSYNGCIPGPVLHVPQGAEVTFDVRNDGDLDATVHWHGLRLQNQYDGVPFETQAPIPIGGRYVQKVAFPDPGIYWYHPHIREDYGLELGLYGTVIVEPTDPSYWPPADRFLSVTLDDLLIEDGKVAPFLRSGPTHTAMGRFGNVMLINGETALAESASVGEVVRLYLVNTANTRIFKFVIDGARMKLIGGDSGRCESESIVDSVLLAPSERAVLDVLFDKEGEVSLQHQTPDHTYHLGNVSVTGTASGDSARSFDELRTDPALRALRAQLPRHLERAPDKTLAFWSEMPLLYGEDGAKSTTDTEYHECPMHSDVAASFAATCPKCGMRLVPTESANPTLTPYVCPMHEEIVASWAATCPRCGMTLLLSEGASEAVTDESRPHTHDRGDSIEWEDDMVAINRETNTENMIWQLIDRDTGAKNGDIQWKFTVGDQVKLRLVNEMGSDHPMPHPFHIHGAGRFIVLSRDGVVEPNLVWKDTVLLLAGQTVDILLDVTNPGLWMAHCHIAEHNQSGMMFSFEVAPRAGAGAL
jgi:FtsP/CotA-like multicopper oxidase with cupredoxin domain